jgi:thiol:disulfide interchange protein DsbC
MIGKRSNLDAARSSARYARRALAVLALLAAIPLWSAAANDGGLSITKAKLAQGLPNVPLESLRPSTSLNGWYELEHGTDVLYVSPDAKFLFVGDLVDLDTQTNLTEAWRAQTAVQQLDAIGEQNMIVMGPRSARRTITVFTDVDCPYCARLHQDVPELTANGVKVRYLMFPRAGLESETYRRSIAVWCAADRVKAVGIAKAGGRINMKTCPNPVAQHYRLGLKLGVSGTPTIFLEDGRRVDGYIPSARLLAILNLKPAPSKSNAN